MYIELQTPTHVIAVVVQFTVTVGPQQSNVLQAAAILDLVIQTRRDPVQMVNVDHCLRVTRFARERSLVIVAPLTDTVDPMGFTVGLKIATLVCVILRSINNSDEWLLFRMNLYCKIHLSRGSTMMINFQSLPWLL
jgi:hypothetical protein